MTIIPEGYESSVITRTEYHGVVFPGVDDFTVSTFAIYGAHAAGSKNGQTQAKLHGSPSFRGAFQCAAACGLTEDSELRSVFTQAFIAALRDAGIH